MEIEEIVEYKTFHVRNLVWLLLSEGPLNEQHTSFLLFPQQVLKQIAKRNKKYIQQLDETGELDVYMLSLKTKRLGIYAEHLLYYFFNGAPHVDLISHGHQLIREKVTIGELDFVITYEGQTYHIELAIKYFLGFPDYLSFSNWIGPSGNDRLSMKLEKVAKHQLLLMNEPEMKEVYASYDVQSYFLLKGHFFVNEQVAIPKWLNPLANRGIYMYLDDFLEHEDVRMKRFMVLQRPNWMAALSLEFSLVESEYLTEAKLKDYLKKDGAVFVKTEDNLLLFVIQKDVVFKLAEK